MPELTLHKIQLASLHLLEALSSEQLYKTIIEEVVLLAEADYGSIFLLKNEKLVRVHSTVPLEFRLNPRPGGHTYTAFETGEIKFLSRKDVFKAHPEANSQYGSSILLPLSYHTKHLGIITLPTQHTELSPLMLNSLKVFASLSVLALRNIELYEETQIALKNRELFMSTAAHELKTPLTTIHAYAQITKKKLGKQEPIEHKWIDAILQNSFRLQTLIKDLFSMSQMEMGIFNYSFERIDLCEQIKSIASDTAVSFKRKILFKNSLKENVFIDGDHDKLILAFNNIIGNSVKYSPAESTISVTLIKKNKHYLIKITDQGSGISAEDLPHIFEQNYQGKHKAAKGMGLGMFLCKEIIEAHHGEIEISSTLGKGTTVMVYFPTSELNA